MAGRHRRKQRNRAENFAVRRWLQLGAASAGVGAGLLGFALLGPQIGGAAADTAGESGTSASASGSDGGDDGSASTGSTGSTAGDTVRETDDDTGGTATEDEPDDSDIADGTEADDDTEADDGTEADEETGADDPAVADETAADVDEPKAADTETRRGVTEAVVPSTDPRPQPQPRAATALKKAPGTWSEVTGRAIDNWTSDSRGWINSLPVDGQAKYHLAGALWATRRTLFNQAPDVAPIQITGKLDGPVTGTVGAVDPDGDRLVYVVTRGPKSGSVQMNSDGSYTYTPGEGFDGVDTFRIVAIDVGPHLNLLDPFRRIGTQATTLVNQRAIRFEFIYTDGAEHWTAERIQALQTATDDLVVYFVVTKPVVLTYDVRGMDDAQSHTLASAGSNLIDDDPGFWPTVVQHKLLTGEDANGAASDGRITWNFGHKWGLGDTVAPDEYDFTSTAMHELMHSFGFIENFDAPGKNSGDFWYVYTRYIVTKDGERPIGDDFEWDADFDPYLDGADGGLYFGGAHAVAAYGGLVPLYMPDPWDSGSSTSHLDDDTFTGANQKLMNAMTGEGRGVRILSSIEIGILRDLGYRVAAPDIRV